MQVAAYVRVSTRQQDLAAQKQAILQAATARGDVIAHWFQEKQGGSKLDRTELKQLRGAVRRGEVGKVYVFRLDRLSRGGIRDTLAVVDEFRRFGCKLLTIADAFDVDGPAGDVVLAVMAWAAQMERQALGDRIGAARERVEAAGGRWGRPRKVDPGTLARARELRAEGKTLRYISAALKIKLATLADALSEKGHYSSRTPPGQK